MVKSLGKMSLRMPLPMVPVAAANNVELLN